MATGERGCMYEVIEISMADTARLFEFLQGGLFGSSFDLKGVDYPWILKAREWRKGERVLDVGAGFSPLPIEIARRYGCEVWAVDDFGAGAADEFWERGKDPVAYAEAHPEVHYVLERLGDERASSLPAESFDCIYSASTLEHVPPEDSGAVWRHMDRLLKPGGEMVHAIDIAFPTSRGLPHVLLAALFDRFFFLAPKRLRRRFLFETPQNYVRFVAHWLNASTRAHLKRLNILNMVINPEIVLESPQHTYNRIIKDGKAGMRHFRVGTLLIHLRKV